MNLNIWKYIFFPLFLQSHEDMLDSFCCIIALLLQSAVEKMKRWMPNVTPPTKSDRTYQRTLRKMWLLLMKKSMCEVRTKQSGSEVPANIEIQNCKGNYTIWCRIQHIPPKLNTKKGDGVKNSLLKWKTCRCCGLSGVCQWEEPAWAAPLTDSFSAAQGDKQYLIASALFLNISLNEMM